MIFFFYFLFFLNFNYDSFNYLFLPACCAPHAGLGIKQFFFTICQENFRICQEKNQGGHKTDTAVSLQQFCLQIQLDSDNLLGPFRGISGSVQKNFQIYLRFLIANFRILTYRHLATYRKQTKKNTRLQVILTSKFCLI